MRSTENAQNLSVQAPHALISRLDALIEWATRQPDISPTGHAKRSDIHRTALSLGVTLLEARAAGKTATAPDEPAVGVFQEPDTVHLLHSDPREAIAHLASIIIGQNDELLAAVKALREEVKAPRPAPAAEDSATETAEPEAPAAEEPAAGETLELALTEPAPAAPVRKRRSFADNVEMQEASRQTSAAIRELAELRKALALCNGARESRKLMQRINDAEKRRAAWGRAYRQLHKIATTSNP